MFKKWWKANLLAIELCLRWEGGHDGLEQELNDANYFWQSDKQEWAYIKPDPSSETILVKIWSSDSGLRKLRIKRNNQN